MVTLIQGWGGLMKGTSTPAYPIIVVPDLILPISVTSAHLTF